MLDKSFIEEIRKEKVIEAANSAAIEGQAFTGGYKPFVALPTNFELHDLEKYMPDRSRFRGNLTTQSVEHFCEYVSHHKGEDKPAVYIDDEHMNAEAFFNLGTIESPGHGDDTALLKLKKTSAYKSICRINGNKMSQRDMAEWLEDWEDNLVAMNGEGKEMSFANAVSQVRNIEIKNQTKVGSSVGNFDESQSTTSETKVSGKDGSLPSGYKFKCETWAGLPERTFILRLAALGDSGLNLKIVKLEAVEEKIVDDFKELLDEKLNSVAEVIVGTFNT